MRLFVPAQDTKRHGDAYLIDSRRLLRPLQLTTNSSANRVVSTLLERIILMGKSMYAVRNRTFAVTFRHQGDQLVVATTEPFHDGVTATLRDALATHGQVTDGADVVWAETDNAPLFAYERGRVSLFDGPQTHAFVPLAGPSGMRVLTATLHHSPAAHFMVDGRPAPAHVAGEPEGITLDLAAMGEMSEADLERLLENQLEDWDG